MFLPLLLLSGAVFLVAGAHSPDVAAERSTADCQGPDVAAERSTADCQGPDVAAEGSTADCQSAAVSMLQVQWTMQQDNDLVALNKTALAPIGNATEGGIEIDHVNMQTQVAAEGNADSTSTSGPASATSWSCTVCATSSLKMSAGDTDFNASVHAGPGGGFHAASLEALSLFRGCGPSSTMKTAKLFPVDIIVVGVQKAGTDSVQESLAAEYPCNPKEENHFFDVPQWSNQSIPPQSREQYLHSWDMCDQSQLRLEKNPNYFLQSWVPYRFCEAQVTSKFILLLRNPIDRAYSGWYTSFIVKSDWSSLPSTAQGFDMFAQIDVSIVNACGFPETGDPQEDVLAQPSFHTCCSAVATSFNQTSWPGCRWEPTDVSWSNGLFGDTKARAVRRGVYVKYLRNWFTYIPVYNMAIYRFEDLVENMTSSLHEMACFAKSSMTFGCNAPLAEVSKNSARADHEPILNKTVTMLKAFYTPYNSDLDSLLGRQMAWW